MDIRDAQRKSGTTVPAQAPTQTPVSEVTTGSEIPDQATQEQDQFTMGFTDELREELYEVGFRDQDFFDIIESVLTTGTCTRKFTLFNRVEGEFTIRPDWVRQVVVRKMEEQAPKTVARFTDTLNRYNLAGSLVQFSNNRFTVETEEDLEAVLVFIGKMPFITVSLLIGELVTFDKLVTVAMSPWALENFIKPQSEK